MEYDKAYEIAPTGRYAPIGAWAYWGLGILFSVPIIGLVFNIIFSFSSSNINRRSFARSYWITYIFFIIIFIILLATGVLAGLVADIF